MIRQIVIGKYMKLNEMAPCRGLSLSQVEDLDLWLLMLQENTGEEEQDNPDL